MATRRVSSDIFPTLDEIAQRAHEIFVAQGKPIRKAADCWRQAEDELLERAASSVTRQLAPDPLRRFVRRKERLDT